MTDWVSLIFGVFVMVFGVLSVITHPVVDGINRWLQAVGTNRRP
jgi:hypothetical protein